MLRRKLFFTWQLSIYRRVSPTIITQVSLHGVQSVVDRIVFWNNSRSLFFLSFLLYLVPPYRCQDYTLHPSYRMRNRIRGMRYFHPRSALLFRRFFLLLVRFGEGVNRFGKGGLLNFVREVLDFAKQLFDWVRGCWFARSELSNFSSCFCFSSNCFGFSFGGPFKWKVSTTFIWIFNLDLFFEFSNQVI